MDNKNYIRTRHSQRVRKWRALENTTKVLRTVYEKLCTACWGGAENGLQSPTQQILDTFLWLVIRVPRI